MNHCTYCRSEAVFKANAHPNPFTVDFNVEVTSSDKQKIKLVVYDLLGKLIEMREMDLDDLEVGKIGTRYPSGVYHVIVTQGNIVKTLRVIKR